MADTTTTTTTTTDGDAGTPKPTGGNAPGDLVQRHIRFERRLSELIDANARATGMTASEYIAAAVADRVRRDAGFIDAPTMVDTRLAELTEKVVSLEHTVETMGRTALASLRGIADLARGDSYLADRVGEAYPTRTGTDGEAR